MVRLFSLMLLGICFLSCATVKSIEIQPSRVEHVFQKNYELNASMEAFIGESIIRVKNYWVEKRTVIKLVAKDDFSIKMAFGPALNYLKGDIFKITGMTDLEGKQALLLETFGQGGVLINIAVYEDGCFANELIGSMNQKLIGWEAKPSIFCFDKADDEEILKSKTFVNYEIVFTGLNDKEITLLYREYTPEDLAKVAFFQNLTYPIGSKIVRFRNLRIALNEITNEKIRYMVVND